MKTNFEDFIKERIDILPKLLQIQQGLTQAVDMMENALSQSHKILVFGNGGSATQSSHFAAELVNRFYRDRRALAAISLATDMANLTSIANDSNYSQVFSRQISALGNPGDIALGITTSGSSTNVLQAFKIAKEMGIITVCLCGLKLDASAASKPDLIIAIESNDTPLIQEMHLLILHWLAATLESKLAK